MDDLTRLRELLLFEEQKKLEELRIQFENFNDELHSSESIIERISPLISSVLEKNYSKDNKLLEDALAPIVLGLIDKNYTESQDKVIKQLTPLITIAIREKIKSQKDEVADALYPILGNMISRYVSKTFEDMISSINNQIKSGLTLKNFTRKIRAKIHGVSETELFLKENILINIKSVFFIHKETGIVLSQVNNSNSEINEPEMVASMLTAIRSFVNEWLDKNEKHQEINTIEYGGSKIVLEASGYSYLAVIIDGAVTKEVINNIKRVLAKLVSDYYKEIKDFNGDSRNIPKEEFNKIISELITSKNEDSLKKIHPIIYIFPLMIVLYLIYFIYNNSIDNKLKNQVNEILYKTPKLTIYRLSADVKDRNITLKGAVPFEVYKKLAYENIEKLENLNSIKNNIQVINTLDNPKEIEDKIIYLLIALNAKEGNKLNYNYDYPYLNISGSVYNNREKQAVIEQFKIINGLEKIKFNIEIVAPKIDLTIHFEENSSEISTNQEYKLIEIINLLHKLDEELVLQVKAYRNNTGTDQRNAILVEQRALNIMKYLKLKGNVSQKLEAIGINEVPSNIDSENYPEQGRQVIFKWKK